MKNDSLGYGKIVDDLSIDDLNKYEQEGISIILVTNEISEEVREAIKNTSLTVYDGIDKEQIEKAFGKLKGDDSNGE